MFTIATILSVTIKNAKLVKLINKINASIQKSYSNYLSTDYSDEQLEYKANGYKMFYDKINLNIAAAFNARRKYRGYVSSGRLKNKIWLT